MCGGRARSHASHTYAGCHSDAIIGSDVSDDHCFISQMRFSRTTASASHLTTNSYTFVRININLKFILFLPDVLKHNKHTHTRSRSRRHVVFRLIQVSPRLTCAIKKNIYKFGMICRTDDGEWRKCRLDSRASSTSAQLSPIFNNNKFQFVPEFRCYFSSEKFSF